MSLNGRRAWRAAAKKLRRKLGRRWRSLEAKWSGKRWSELVPDLEAHRAHVTGAWFRRHGLTELDPRYQIRQYIGLWGTADGDEVEFVVKSRSFTARSLVGMTQGARKRVYRNAVNTLECADVWRGDVVDRKRLRIGERLRPCHGCTACNNTMSCCGCRHGYEPWDNRYAHHICDPEGPCDGSGVLPARRSK